MSMAAFSIGIGNLWKFPYVVGNNGGGRFAGEYPNAIPGISHSLALTSGMVAGRNAAAAIA